ncbi:MAG: hypothetical protein JNM17_25230, partial [Archangium sp.]|nr:hypothetical protein [Archangium sp.]
VLGAVVLVLAIAVVFAFSRPPPDLAATEVIASRPPVDTKPVDTKPVDTKPVDTKPLDTKPLDTKPVDTKPLDTRPLDTKPVDAKPLDTKPVDAKPVVKTAVPVPVIKGVPGPAGKRPLVMLALEQRIANARAAAGKLSAPAQRRLMNTELDELETRLKDGERPRRIAKDLDEVLERYAAKP